ncbi:hypothetical protein [Sinomicrobium oceani]|uniref:hypothetical protein n=1 Tax=Sinomicrobium oceani TaxID=1150368 RepID=UPI00227C7E95|nr:hypothetical protein [Sinomicrobium oceani]
MRFQGIYRVLLLWVCGFLVSCLNDVDFDQVNDFEMEPVVENSLVYLEYPVPVVMDSIPLGLTISDTTGIELFSNSFTVDNLKKAVLYFETLSTVGQPLSLEIQLMDDNFVVLQEVAMSLPPSDGQTEQVSAEELIYTEENVEQLTYVTHVAFSVDIPYISNRNENAYVKLKSKGTFYLHIE